MAHVGSNGEKGAKVSGRSAMMPIRGEVLVVDDEESVRGVLKRALEEAGYHVSTAADGEEALDKVSRQETEVMLLDIRMPGLTGIDVLQKVMKDYPDTSVVMVSAVADAATAVGAMKAGAYDYVTKPFTLHDVALRVRNALERRRLVLRSKEYQQELEGRVQEQAVRLKEQFSQLIQGLAREHTLLFTLDSKGQSKGGKVPLPGLPPELQKPAASVEEFAKALIQAIKSGSLSRN